MTVYHVSPERGVHRCKPPTGYQSEMIVGDVWECDDCAAWWVLKWGEYGNYLKRVHWWNWRVRGRMKERWC